MEVPISANTENTVCVSCCTSGNCNTVTVVIPPHPQWTNEKGRTVIQMNAITLGGPNGLNN